MTLTGRPGARANPLAVSHVVGCVGAPAERAVICEGTAASGVVLIRSGILSARRPTPPAFQNQIRGMNRLKESMKRIAHLAGFLSFVIGSQGLDQRDGRVAPGASRSVRISVHKFQRPFRTVLPSPFADLEHRRKVGVAV